MKNKDVLRERWVEVFRTGVHTSAQGITSRWTLQHLDTWIQNFIGAPNEIPFVKGHPEKIQSADPAGGWVTELQRRGESLWAKIKPTSVEFLNQIRRGEYRNISISLDKLGTTIRHIGVLGAAQPSVQNMEPMMWNSGEQVIILPTYPLSPEWFTDPLTGSDVIQYHSIQKTQEVKSMTVEEVLENKEIMKELKERFTIEAGAGHNFQSPTEVQALREEVRGMHDAMEALKKEKEELEAKATLAEKHEFIARTATELSIPEGSITDPLKKILLPQTNETIKEVLTSLITAEKQPLKQQEQSSFNQLEKEPAVSLLNFSKDGVVRTEGTAIDIDKGKRIFAKSFKSLNQ